MTDTDTVNVKDYIDEHYPDETVIIATGFDAAFLGIGFSFTQAFACYDTERAIQVLMKDDMTHEEAREYFDFNVVGAYIGPGTPVFIEPLTKA